MEHRIEIQQYYEKQDTPREGHTQEEEDNRRKIK
jgi:hypothetical protein